MRILIVAVSVLALATVFSSCSVDRSSRPLRRADRVLYQWHDDGGPGKVAVRISLKDQIAEFERGGREIGWCYVATGKEGHGTSDGTYKITEKIVDKHSNLYGWIEDEFGNVVDGDAKSRDPVPEGMVYVPAPMPYWMRLTSYGIGMHGGLIPEPGKPASHGCIRMPKDFVPTVFDVVEVGTPVTITHTPSKRSQAMARPVMARGVAPGEMVPRSGTPDGNGRVISTRPLTEEDIRRLGPIPPRRYMTEPFSAY